jgi:hypothetical protein
MAKYASDTSVSAESSRAEIERTLRRYKADAFAYGTEGDRASVMFRLQGRAVRFILVMPDPNAREFTHHSRGMRTPDAAAKAWEQATRQRWRALALVIKAKLEAVDAGITTVEDEFLAHTLLPDGRTFGDYAKPEIDRIYIEGGMPQPLMLTGPKS